jgi:hypothetical protein
MYSLVVVVLREGWTLLKAYALCREKKVTPTATRRRGTMNRITIFFCGSSRRNGGKETEKQQRVVAFDLHRV